MCLWSEPSFLLLAKSCLGAKSTNAAILKSHYDTLLYYKEDCECHGVLG